MIAHTVRTLRGGSWHSDTQSCYSASHDRHDPDVRNLNLGFRLINRYKPRVIRGGSWGSVAQGCRFAYRDGLGPDICLHSLGFRLAERRSR